MVNVYEEVDLLECPVCQGPGVLEEENGWCFYVNCMDCGCRTAEIGYTTDDERLIAAKKAGALWNNGKVISHSPGE